MPGAATIESVLTEDDFHYPGWLVGLAAAGGLFFSFASLVVYTFGVFLKPLTAQFGWSRESASAAFGIAALAVAVSSPILGLLLDRYPARRIILPCVAVFGSAFASLALMTPHLWHLYLVFLALGIVGNGTAHLAYSRAVATWFSKRRGTAFALLMTGAGVGAIVFPPLAGKLIQLVGWRNAFAILGALALAVGLPLGFSVRERDGSPPRENTAAPGPSASGLPVREAIRSRVFWILVIVLFCASLSQNGAITHLTAMLTDRGVSPNGASLAVSALGGALLAGRLITGWLLDRFFAPRVAAVLLTLAAGGAALLAGAHSMTMGVTGATLIGLGMGGEADVIPYLLVKYFGLRAFSTLYGLTWTAYMIAGAIGPVIMGKAFDATGSYQALLLNLAALTAASAMLMLWMPRHVSCPPTNAFNEAVA
jgi:predicted MFS family arabinose efflux permease